MTDRNLKVESDLETRLKSLRPEEKIDIRADNGALGYVKRKHRSFVLVALDNKERSCWGNREEILQDTEHFIEHGKLRPPISERW